MMGYMQGVFFMMSFILTIINLILFVLIVKFFLFVVKEKNKIIQIGLEVDQTKHKIADIVKTTVSNFMKALEDEPEAEPGQVDDLEE